MSDLEHAVGQLIMVGFEGLGASPELARLADELRPGGFIIMAGNYKDPAQLHALVRHLWGLCPDAPPFLAVDQEGGRVNRLGPPFTQFPAARRLGEIGSEKHARAMGHAIGRELRGVGLNMDLAPVLDVVPTESGNTVIGDRAFGPAPLLVARLGLAFLKGLKMGGVIPVGKHFPGHGGTALDSHVALPVVKACGACLREIELAPFRAAVEAGIPALMTAHVLYAALDREWPATLSFKVLTSLLRDELGFGGVVITDDLRMGAISTLMSPGEAAVLSVEAGADIVLVCDSKSALEVLPALLNAVRRGRIREPRLEQSLRRISRLKQEYLKGGPPLHRLNLIGSARHARIADLIAAFPGKGDLTPGSPP